MEPSFISLGGFNKNLEFKKMRYFNVDTIAGQWKYHVLKIIENGSYPSKKIEKATKNTAAKLYKENKRFFFNVGSNKEITFFFNDLANNKKETYITMPLFPIF